MHPWSKQCGSPAGAPAYPTETGLPSIAMMAPTCLRVQVDRLEAIIAISISI
jgi:hypothetical protein